MLPNFFLIGAMKGGTSSLWQYLRSHPQVAMSTAKEPSFFVDNNWYRGFAWYEGFFPADPDGLVAVGEASTGYTKYPVLRGAAPRIRRHVPSARFIYVVREPVDRMRSHYVHELRSGVERLPLERALVEKPHYLDTSRYAYQLERYLEHFPLDRFLLLTSDDLRHRRLETMRRVWAFLGVRDDWVPPNLQEDYHRSEAQLGLRRTARRLHGRTPVRAIARLTPVPVKRLSHLLTMRRFRPSRFDVPEDLRGRLRDALAEDVARLRGYMGDGFDGWGIA